MFLAAVTIGTSARADDAGLPFDLQGTFMNDFAFFFAAAQYVLTGENRRLRRSTASFSRAKPSRELGSAARIMANWVLTDLEGVGNSQSFQTRFQIDY